MKSLVPCVAAGVASVGTLGVSARAQEAAPPVQVSTVPVPNPNNFRNSEPVIVASAKHSPDVIVAWIGRQTDVEPIELRIRYRVSTTGFLGALPPDPSILPSPNTSAGPCGPCSWPFGGDPAVARSQVTGDLFLGAVFTDGPGTHLGIARKALHEPDLERDPLPPNDVIVRHAVACGTSGSYDFPGLAAGPKPPELPSYMAPEALYFVSSGIAPPFNYMRSIRSVAAATLGSAWQCAETTPPSNNGYPYFIASGEPPGFQQLGLPRGVVIQGGVRAGRLIVVATSRFPADSSPETTWTDEGGGPVIPSPFHNPWAAARLLNRYGPPVPPSQTSLPVAGVYPTVGGVPVPPDIADQFKNTPMIATDPNNPSEVYIAFLGRSTDDTPNRIDLFIAQTSTGNRPTQDGGVRFQGSDTGAEWGELHKTHRIPDEWLVIPGDPPLSTHQAEQFLQTIAIDELGGINLLFCQAFECVAGCESAAPPTLFTVRYARWPNRAALEAGQPPALRVLSPLPSVPWQLGVGHDYQGLTASGCLVYAAWASKHSGEWHVYVTRITLPCAADADSSGTIDTLDPITFGMQFAAQQTEADVNEDGLINPQDFSDFLTAYSCGACPIP